MVCLTLVLAVVCAPMLAARCAAAQSTGTAQTLPEAPQAFGSISGTVTDSAGALVSGATLTLKAGNLVRSATSTSDGTFAFTGVPAGRFSVTAALTGFDAVTVNDTVSPGQTYTLPDIKMKMATVDVSVNAVTQKQMAELQVHAEEQQRVLGVLPNFFVAYDWNAAPLTPKQKFKLVAATFRDPVNIIIAAGVAGVQQAENDFSGYGQGAQGYGKRFGANYGSLAIGSILGGGVYPVLFRQDPRYFYKGTGSVSSRLVYALSSAVICRGDNGKRQPAYASVLGDLSAGAISNAYYPASDRNGVGLTLANGFIAVGGDAVGNVFQEFVVRKFTPKSRRGLVNAVTSETIAH